MISLFWISLGLVAYVLAGYPALLFLLHRRSRSSPDSFAPMSADVDVVIPAHNEQDIILEKLRNTLACADETPHQVRVTLVCDGSTDETAHRARTVTDPRVRIVETPCRMGKLGAINHVLPSLKADIVVFSDANAILSPGALRHMLHHFGDPRTGGVCGQIAVDTRSGGAIAKADALYWRYDQWMKQAESSLGGVVSAQGAIYAIRRDLAGPVPEGTADDFIMSTRVVAAGSRLVFEERCSAREAVTEHPGNETGRRVRSVDMGCRAMWKMRALLNPFRFGLYSWHLLSHKVLRLAIPLALAGMFVSSLFLAGSGAGWTLLAVAQSIFYLIALLCTFWPSFRSVPFGSKAMFFCMANLATLLGVLSSMRPQKRGTWTPVRDAGTL